MHFNYVVGWKYLLSAFFLFDRKAILTLRKKIIVIRRIENLSGFEK